MKVSYDVSYEGVCVCVYVCVLSEDINHFRWEEETKKEEKTKKKRETQKDITKKNKKKNK